MSGEGNVNLQVTQDTEEKYTERKLVLDYIDFCVTRCALLASFPRATQNFPASAIAAIS